jgi:hypothetical protein
MKSIPTSLWYKKEPNNEDNKQAVLGFSVADDGFFDLNLDIRLYVICEVHFLRHFYRVISIYLKS